MQNGGYYKATFSFHDFFENYIYFISIYSAVQELSLPFTKATELLSGEKYPTLSMVLPIVRCIQDSIQRRDCGANNSIAEFKVFNF